MDGGDAANIGVALATLGLAYYTAKMASRTKTMADETHKAVETAREELKLTRDALVASQRLAEEATAARIDARAPRVVVVLEPRGWPPYAGRPWISGTLQLTPDDRFTYPQHKGKRIWFQSKLRIRNDGAATAFITLQKWDPEDRLLIQTGAVLTGGAKADTAFARYALGPGTRVRWT